MRHTGLAALGMHGTAAQHSVLLQRAQLCTIHDFDCNLLPRQGILRLQAGGLLEARGGNVTCELLPNSPTHVPNKEWEKG